TYAQVCAKNTGHAEAVEVTFDPDQVSYSELVRRFFKLHDPTKDRTDRGGQYRSAIFYHSEAQQTAALEALNALRNQGVEPVTQVVEATEFWEAEERHQGWCERTGIGVE
ncbi:MAG: peptide-methionine (S)-S-oxide reductase, partial [Saprospiraceae bacterium]